MEWVPIDSLNVQTVGAVTHIMVKGISHGKKGAVNLNYRGNMWLHIN